MRVQKRRCDEALCRGESRSGFDTVIEVGVDCAKCFGDGSRTCRTVRLSKLHNCAAVAWRRRVLPDPHFLTEDGSGHGRLGTWNAHEVLGCGKGFGDPGRRRILGTKQSGIPEFRVGTIVRDRDS